MARTPTRPRRSWAFALTLAWALMGACAQPVTDPQPLSHDPASMTENAHTHHSIDYIEFAVSDMAAAKRFYEAAFGWTFNDYGPEYAGIHKDGRVDAEVGGLRLDTEVVPGGPLVILYSTDLAESVAAVRAAGGRILQEPFDFPGGHRFHFADPSGNELAVWAEK
jgi:predicted enzyme related to lactoylglutathione lyase